MANIYISNCCNAAAVKPACVKPPKDDRTGYSTLGKWRCSKCGNKTKVQRVNE